MADGNHLTAGDIGVDVAVDDDADFLDLRTARETAERQAVIAALGRSNGNVVRAAEMLGVSRPTLYDLMHKLGLKT